VRDPSCAEARLSLVPVHAYAPCRLPEQGLVIGCKLHRGQEVMDPISRKGPVNGGEIFPRPIESSGQGKDKDSIARIWACAFGRVAALTPPERGFLEVALSDKRHCPGAKHAKQHRGEGAEIARLVGRRDGRAWIANLRMNECQRVMPLREIGAQVDTRLQFAE